MKILIAEDGFPRRGMLATVLRKAGHEPGDLIANDLEAWQALQSLIRPGRSSLTG